MSYLPPSQNNTIYDPLADTSKVGVLAQKRNEKIATLGNKVGNSDVTKDLYNDWNPAEWQYVFNRAIEEEQLNEGGTAYLNNPDSSYTGPSGIFYAHGTNRLDQPTDPALRDIKPGYAGGHWSSSKARQTYFNRGPEGVNVDDVIFNYRFPEMTARTLEAISRGNSTAMDQRLNKEYSEEAKRRFGSGYTEILARREDGRGLYGDASLFPSITPERGEELFSQFKAFKEQMFKSAYPDYKGTLEDFNKGDLSTEDSTTYNTGSTQDPFESLQKAMRKRESNNNYSAINSLDYVGGYQFGAQALETLGYLKEGSYKRGKNKSIYNSDNWTGKGGINSIDDFLSNPEAQDRAFEENADFNLKQLRRLGIVDDNTPVEHIAGYLASSHLLGAGNAKNLNKQDAYGTKGQEYFDLGVSAFSDGSYKASPELTRDQEIAQYREEMQRAEVERGDLLDRTSNLGKRFVGGVYREAVVDLADWVGESLNKFTNGTVGWDLGDSEKKTEHVNNTFGINPYYAEKEFQEAHNSAEKIFDTYSETGEVNYSEAFKLIKLGITTPELFIDSASFITSTFIPFLGWGGKASKASKISNIENALKAGEITAKQAKEQVRVANLVGNTRQFVQNNAGIMQIAAGNVNDQIDEYKKEHNEDPSVLKVATMFTTESLLLGLDRLTDLSILKAPTSLLGAGKAFSSIPKAEKAKVLSKVLGNTAGLVGNMGKEAAQEYLQEIGQEFNVKFNFDDNGDFLSAIDEAGEILLSKDVQVSGITGAGLGAGGAVQFAGVGTAFKGLKSIGGKTTEKVSDVKNKVTNKVTEETKVDPEYNKKPTYVFNESIIEGNDKKVEGIVNKVRDSINNQVHVGIFKELPPKELLEKAKEHASILGYANDEETLNTFIDQIVNNSELSKDEVEVALGVSFAESNELAEIEAENPELGNMLRKADNLKRAGKLKNNTDLVNSIKEAAIALEDTSVLEASSRIIGEKIDLVKKESDKVKEPISSIVDKAKEVSDNKLSVDSALKDVEKTSYVLGSKKEALDKIIELDSLEVTGSRGAERKEEAIRKIAESNDLSDSVVNVIRKTAKDVDLEATVGKGGYKTYGETLKFLEENGLTEEAEVIRSKLKKFLDSQEDAANKLSKGIEEALKVTNDKGMTKVETGFIKSDGQPFDIGKFDGRVIKTQLKQAESLLDVKNKNISGIKEALGLDINKTSTKKEVTPTTNTTSKKITTSKETTKKEESSKVIEKVETKEDKKVDTTTDVKPKKDYVEAINFTIQSLKNGDSDQDIISGLMKNLTENEANRILSAAKKDIEPVTPRRVIMDVLKNSLYSGKGLYAVVKGKAQLRIDKAPLGTKALLQRNPFEYLRVANETTLNTYIFFNKEIKRITEEAKNTLNSFIRPITDFEKDINDQRSFESAESPSRGLIFDKNGEMNDNVVLAIKAAITESLRFDRDLYSKAWKTPQEIARMFGFNDESEVSYELFELVKDKGVMLDTIADSLGAKVISLLGLAEGKESSDIQNFARLKADLGNAAVQLAVAEGYIEFIGIDGNELNIAIGEGSKLSEEVTVNFASFVKEKEDIGHITKEADILTKGIPEVKSKKSDVYLSKVPNSVIKKRTSGYHNGKIGLVPSKTHQKALKKLIDTEQVLDYELARELLFYKDSWMRSAGYLDENSKEFKNLSYRDQQGQKGKNRKVLNDINSLEDVLKGNNKDISMWFEWYITTNQRVMIDSNTINPMNDKHGHRWIVQPKGMETEVNVSTKDNITTFTDKEGKDITSSVKYALSQAFGFAVDKKNSSKIEEFGSSLLSLGNEDISTMKKELMEKGEYTFTDTNTGKEFTAEIEHIGHVLQGLKFLQQAKNNSKFTTKLSAEFDAVTSGFGLKLLQMPIIGTSEVGKRLVDYLARVGIVLPSKLNNDALSMNDLLDSEGFLDNYETLASDIRTDISFDNIKMNIAAKNKREQGFISKIMSQQSNNVNMTVWNILRENLPRAVDGEVSKELRNLFKDPFMTFNYARSIKNIVNGLSTTIIDNLLGDLTKTDLDSLKPEQKRMVNAIRKVTNIKYEEVQDLLRTTDPTKIKVGNSNLQEYLSMFVKLSYGEEVDRILNKQFGPFIEAQKSVTEAFTYAYEVFDYEYNKRMDIVRKAGKVGKKGGSLTTEDKKEIVKELLEVFPLIDGPLSEDFKTSIELKYLRAKEGEVEGNFEDGAISVFNQERQRGEDMLKTQFAVRKGYESKVVNPKIKDFAAPGVSGSVLPIHSIDAAVLLSNYLDHGDMMLIHDAIIPKLDKMNESVKGYNENVLKVNKNYSFIQSINDMVKRVNNFTESNLNKDRDSKQVKWRPEWSEYGEVFSLKQMGTVVTRDFQRLSNKVQNMRTKLFEAIEEDIDSKLMHMAGMKEGVYSKFDEKEKVVNDEIRSQFSDTIADMLENLHDIINKPCN